MSARSRSRSTTSTAAGREHARRAARPRRRVARGVRVVEDGELKDATALFKRLESTLATEIYRWTGHFPERARPLLRQLAERAARLELRYPAGDEPRVIVALTALVTALAMNHVHHGSYLP